MAGQINNIPVNNIDIIPQRFERKYYLRPGNVGLAYGLLRQVCRTAPEYPSEQINSLYFDTAELDQYERSDSGDYAKDKVRIRWYGDDKNLVGNQTIFLELKSRRGFTSTKQRLKLQVSAADLAPAGLRRGSVSGNLLMDVLAKFGYFPLDRLQPVIKISYWRYRFSEIMTGQRISLDQQIRSTMVIPGSGNGETELPLPGGVIEIKGQSMELPLTIRRIGILDVDWTRFSKYSACIDSHLETPGTAGRLSPSGRMVPYRS